MSGSSATAALIIASQQRVNKIIADYFKDHGATSSETAIVPDESELRTRLKSPNFTFKPTRFYFIFSTNDNKYYFSQQAVDARNKSTAVSLLLMLLTVAVIVGLALYVG